MVRKEDLEKNNICVCSALSYFKELESQMCFMSCGKRQNLTKEQIEEILKNSTNAA